MVRRDVAFRGRHSIATLLYIHAYSEDKKGHLVQQKTAGITARRFLFVVGRAGLETRDATG